MTGLEPLTILTIASTAVSAIGSISQGNAANRAAQRNAQALFQQAHASRLAAAENERRQRRLGRKRQGTLRARASGDVNLDLLEDSAMEEELAALDFRHRGAVEAIGFENQARSEIARGRAARKSGLFGAATGVIFSGFGLAAGGHLKGLIPSPLSVTVSSSVSGGGFRLLNSLGTGAASFPPIKLTPLIRGGTI